MSRELKKYLIEHEGLRLKPYVDTVGKTTIGVGRNLTDNGITEDEAMLLLEHDIAGARGSLRHFGWFNDLDYVRQDVLAELVFNIGYPRFLTFKKMIAALEDGDYTLAAYELLDSKWALQVGSNRSNNMHMRLRDGYSYNL